MGCNIVPAAPEHVTLIFDMVCELAAYEKLSHMVSGTARDLHDELFGAQPVIEAIVALRDNAAVGYALYFHNYSTFLARRGLYLEDIYVKPQHRGNGYGKAMLVHLAKLALQRGCGRFEWTVLDWNEPSIRFYQSLGATVLPDWRVVRVTGAALQQLAQR